MKMGSAVRKRPARKKAITDKMGEKYLERYKKHFKNPDIIKYRWKHEELLACYPKLWSEEVAGCAADFNRCKNFWSEVLLTFVKIVYTGIKHTDQGGPFLWQVKHVSKNSINL